MMTEEEVRAAENLANELRSLIIAKEHADHVIPAAAVTVLLGEIIENIQCRGCRKKAAKLARVSVKSAIAAPIEQAQQHLH